MCCSSSSYDDRPSLLNGIRSGLELRLFLSGGEPTISSSRLRRRVNELGAIALADSCPLSSTRRPLVVIRKKGRGTEWNSVHLFEMFLTKPDRNGVEPPGVRGTPFVLSISARRESSDWSSFVKSSGGDAGCGGGRGGDQSVRFFGGDHALALPELPGLGGEPESDSEP
jgi:hypothetical protein